VIRGRYWAEHSLILVSEQAEPNSSDMLAYLASQMISDNQQELQGARIGSSPTIRPEPLFRFDNPVSRPRRIKNGRAKER